MKAVLVSIRPRWAQDIACGAKKLEIRRNRPKLRTPFKCYIYQTAGDYARRRDPWTTAAFPPTGEMYNGSQKVIGEFICDSIMRNCHMQNADFAHHLGLLSMEEIVEYSEDNTKELFGWAISSIQIYDKPKVLADFGLKRPPQSWCYVEEIT